MQLGALKSWACLAGPAYEPYAQATFDRCMRILAMQLAASGAAGMANGHPPPIEPEKEFVICSLDLISGLAESLGPAMEAYVGRSNLRVILVQCCGVGCPSCFLLPRHPPSLTGFCICTEPLRSRGARYSHSELRPAPCTPVLLGLVKAPDRRLPMEWDNAQGRPG